MPFAFLVTFTLSAAFAIAVATLAPTAFGLRAASPDLFTVAAAQALGGTLVYQAVGSLIDAPLVLAVHRFILLGERSFFLSLVPVSRVLRFAGWLTAFRFAQAVVDWVVSALDASGATASVIGFLASIAAIVISVRLVLVFPRIAVEAPGSELQEGWGDTRGLFWRIFAVLLIMALPVALAFVVVATRLYSLSELSALAQSPSAFLIAVMSVTGDVVLVTAAAAASWLFRHYVQGGDAERRALVEEFP